METAGLTEPERQAFRLQLLSWFRLNARDLPWRRTRDPYCIWVSEVMLQQTRVATVVDRYTEFIQRFPSLVSLALAKEDEILALWSGLGYYRRARMLHSAAQLLVNEHGGSLPRSSLELRRLPGVGDYTAAAIASIAYGEAVAVIDGNVERVLMRLLGKAATTTSRGRLAARLKEAASELLDPQAPGIFNQAMMELGAMVCLPQIPLCGECPVYDFCQTRGVHPVRPRKQMASHKTQYALVKKPLKKGGRQVAVLLVQRPPDASQMPGMWELPALADEACAEARMGEPVLRIRHAITQTNFYVQVFSVDAERFRSHTALSDGDHHDWVAAGKLIEIPLTGLARKILMRLDVLAKPRHVRQGKALPGAEDAFL